VNSDVSGENRMASLNNLDKYVQEAGGGDYANGYGNNSCERETTPPGYGYEGDYGYEEEDDDEGTTDPLTLGGQFLVQCGICSKSVSVQEYKDHAAICKLSLSLQQAEFAIPITHGESRMWRKAKFQAHAAPVRYLADVEYVVQQLSTSLPWSNANFQACAYRLSIDAAGGGGTGANSEEATVLEGQRDDGDPGVGDKLLYLLQRWEVQNVVLVVSAWDDGIRGRLGAARYRVYLQHAKEVLEQCYLEAMQSKEVLSEDGGNETEESGQDVSSNYAENYSDAQMSNFTVLSTNATSTAVSTIDPSSSAAGTRSGSSMYDQGHLSMDDDHSSFKGVDFADVYAQERARQTATKNRPTVPMKPVIMTTDTVDFPKGKLVNGFYVGEKKGRPNHFLGAVEESPSPTPKANAIQEARPIPLPQFSREQLFEAKRIVRPHEQVHRVFFCVSKFLGNPDTSWEGIREMISKESFLRKIVSLDPICIPMADIDSVRDELMDTHFNPETLRRRSLLAADLLAWSIRVVQEYDRITTGIEIQNNVHEQLGEVTVRNGKTVVELAPRRLTLGDDFVVSRVQARSAIKKPLTAPLHQRDDTGPPKVSIPSLGRPQRGMGPLAAVGSNLNGAGQRETYRGSSNKGSKFTINKGKDTVRLSGRMSAMSNRSAKSGSRGSSRGENNVRGWNQ
jgi:hypothetical protein